jgi:uridine kinase
MGFHFGRTGKFVLLHSLDKEMMCVLQIGTGAAAFMAIRVLLDHGIPQNHIIFVTFLVARHGGINVLHRAFPHVRIVCGAVDDEMKETWLEDPRTDGSNRTDGRKIWVMQPGMGQIGAEPLIFFSLTMELM